MSGLVDIVFNIELSLLLGMIASFVLGFLLILIKVPGTEYSKKIVNTKNAIAACYMMVSVLFFVTLRYSGIADFDILASLMMFTITATASVILSFSLITVLDPQGFDKDKFILNLGLAIILSYVLGRSFWWESHLAKVITITTCICIFIAQCVIHILKFRKTYKDCVKKLEVYYDDEEDHKIRWVRFCYVIMMLTQMFVLVYLLLPSGMMKIYIAFYSLFLLYFTANFISFLGSHKLALDAFAYKALSGHLITKDRSVPNVNTIDLNLPQCSCAQIVVAHRRKHGSLRPGSGCMGAKIQRRAAKIGAVTEYIK